ncbi:histidinol dehydrogenase [Alphaproteobacteria bacterium]|nr:histidinol dehydrogenase [Alphaproteobacteria bacterium]
MLVKDLKNCHNIINNIAPEHLHLQNKDRNKIHKKVNNAGAIFLGEYSSEVFGDYIVGTNHILPTSGTAKFSSGLGVLDFMKRTSVVEMNFSGYQKYASKVVKMANIENLEGHKLSVKIRQNDKK